MSSNFFVKIKPGILVKLKEPKVSTTYLKETWPPAPECNNKSLLPLFETSSTFLGLAISRSENGYATVAWFKPIPNDNDDEYSPCVIIERSAVNAESNVEPTRSIFSCDVMDHSVSRQLAQFY